MNINSPGLASVLRRSAKPVWAVVVVAFVIGAGGCVSNYLVAPLPDPASSTTDAAAVGLGDLVVVHKRDGTTVNGQIVALDDKEVVLQPRRSAAPAVRIPRAEIVKVERFDTARLATNILVVGAVVIGVVMILMAAPNLGLTGY